MDEKDNEAASSALPRSELRSVKGTTKLDHRESFEGKGSFEGKNGIVDITDHGRTIELGIQCAQSDSDGRRTPPPKSTKSNRGSNVSDTDGDFAVLIKANMHLAQLVVLDKSLNENVTDFEKEIDETFDMDLYSKKPQTLKERIVQPFKVIFITMEVESSSTLAWIWSVVSKLVILAAILSSIIATEPLFAYFPSTCFDPSCSNDPVLCPNTTLCAPQPYPIFDTIDTICIYIFTAEYAARFLTCWSVSAKIAGIVSKVDPVVHKVLKNTVISKEFHPLEQIVRWMLCIKNLIDLACWLPFYVGTLIGLSPRYSAFVRVLRLLRLVRVLRLWVVLSMFENIHVMTELLQKTCTAAWPVVAVFMFFSFLIVILFGCIIFILEQGTFTVNDDYPQGAFIRLALNRYDYEVSPFVSIGTSFYWVIVTGATVGYGDLVPTSYAGRALASLTCFFGILGLAFPVGVLGSEFTRVFNAHYNRLRTRIVEKKRLAKQTAALAEKRNQIMRHGTKKPPSLLDSLGSDKAKAFINPNRSGKNK